MSLIFFFRFEERAAGRPEIWFENIACFKFDNWLKCMQKNKETENCKCGQAFHFWYFLDFFFRTWILYDGPVFKYMILFYFYYTQNKLSYYITAPCKKLRYPPFFDHKSATKPPSEHKREQMIQHKTQVESSR